MSLIKGFSQHRVQTISTLRGNTMRHKGQIQKCQNEKEQWKQTDRCYKNDIDGAPAFDPAALIKIILLAYSRGIISSRKIEAACRENVLFIAVSGDSRPRLSPIWAIPSPSSLPKFCWSATGKGSSGVRCSPLMGSSCRPTPVKPNQAPAWITNGRSQRWKLPPRK